MGKAFFELPADTALEDALTQRILWEPGKQTAELFLAFVHALETGFDLAAGVVAIDDENYALRADRFPAFAERVGTAIAAAPNVKQFWNTTPHPVATDARRLPAPTHGLRFVSALSYRLTGAWPAYAQDNPLLLQEARAFEGTLPSPRLP